MIPLLLALALVFPAQLVLARLQPSASHPGQPPSPADQEPPRPAPPPEPQLDPADIPVSIDKIQKALSQPPAIKVTEQHPVFRVEIFGRQPTILEMLGPDFLPKVPQQGATPLYHQEFLNMVTPPEYRGYASYTNLEALQLAGTSFLLQYALQKAIQRLQDARTERAREAARREVERALEDIRKAQREGR